MAQAKTSLRSAVAARNAGKTQTNATADQLVATLRDTMVSLVRRDGPDLSARQMAVFLTCYLQEEGHTVRGLAADLNVSKPAITRALDRLGELDLARRKVDPLDRRSVLVQRTLKGAAYLREIRSIMGEAGTAPRKEVEERIKRVA
ncbi:MarR family transcriptional regulator [Acetobacter sp.]|uniref:MarR family transcriptional regulator n=1 Tax=Acetobacter sp. TaxID=440 RepID=UPI0039E8163D